MQSRNFYKKLNGNDKILILYNTFLKIFKEQEGRTGHVGVERLVSLGGNRTREVGVGG
jgi:hypothetical protein